MVISGPGTIQLYDLRTGRLADLGAPKRPGTYRPAGRDDRLYSMEQADGYLIVDLTVIG